MWGVRKDQSKNECFLALDIGTEFVKAVVVKPDGESGKNAAVVGWGQQRQAESAMLAGAVADIDSVVRACRLAIDQAAAMSRSRPRKAVVGIAGEYIKGATAHFVYQRENPEQPIDLAELKNIIQKIQCRSFDQARGQLAVETGRSEMEIRLVNSLVSEVKIDGYQISNPLEFKGKEVFLNIFNIFAPLVHLRAVESIAAKLDLELLSVVAEPYALAKALGFAPKGGAIFIDIGGGTTDITLIRQGRVEDIKSFALAGRTFTKRLSQVLDLNWQQAEELKVRHGHKTLSANVQKKVKTILARDTQIWLEGLELILEEFGRSEYFPAAIFLCGGGSRLPAIGRILKNEGLRTSWKESFPFSAIPEVSYLKASQINNVVDKIGLPDGPENITPLALANLTLEIALDQQNDFSSVLRRMVRIIRQ